MFHRMSKWINVDRVHVDHLPVHFGQLA